MRPSPASNRWRLPSTLPQKRYALAAREQAQRMHHRGVLDELALKGLHVHLAGEPVHERGAQASVGIDDADARRRRVHEPLVLGERAVGGAELEREGGQVGQDQYQPGDHREAVLLELAPHQLPLRGNEVALLGAGFGSGFGSGPGLGHGPGNALAVRRRARRARFRVRSGAAGRGSRVHRARTGVVTAGSVSRHLSHPSRSGCAGPPPPAGRPIPARRSPPARSASSARSPPG